MKSSSSVIRAFSLVEITLALGIAAVALVTTIGLLGVAAGANGDAGRDTNLVTMTNAVLNELRAAPSFESLWFADPRAKGYVPKDAKKTASDTPEDSSYFFTLDGTMVEKGHADVIYECIVKKSPDLPLPRETRGLSNLLKLQLHFSSPVSANPNDPSKRPNQNLIHASIARF